MALERRKELENFIAKPEENDVFKWHFIIFGLKDSPFEGGFYHGMLKFPVTYPFKPPEIWFMTPNGRFKTNMAVCLSISSFHPESWSAAWGVTQIMIGIISFMHENEITYGGIDSTAETKREFA